MLDGSSQWPPSLAFLWQSYLSFLFLKKKIPIYLAVSLLKFDLFIICCDPDRHEHCFDRGFWFWAWGGSGSSFSKRTTQKISNLWSFCPIACFRRIFWTILYTICKETAGTMPFRTRTRKRKRSEKRTHRSHRGDGPNSIGHNAANQKAQLIFGPRKGRPIFAVIRLELTVQLVSTSRTAQIVYGTMRWPVLYKGRYFGLQLATAGCTWTVVQAGPKRPILKDGKHRISPSAMYGPSRNLDGQGLLSVTSKLSFCSRDFTVKYQNFFYLMVSCQIL